MTFSVCTTKSLLSFHRGRNIIFNLTKLYLCFYLVEGGTLASTSSANVGHERLQLCW